MASPDAIRRALLVLLGRAEKYTGKSGDLPLSSDIPITPKTGVDPRDAAATRTLIEQFDDLSPVTVRSKVEVGPPDIRDNPTKLVKDQFGEDPTNLGDVEGRAARFVTQESPFPEVGDIPSKKMNRRLKKFLGRTTENKRKSPKERAIAQARLNKLTVSNLEEATTGSEGPRINPRGELKPVMASQGGREVIANKNRRPNQTIIDEETPVRLVDPVTNPKLPEGPSTVEPNVVGSVTDRRAPSPDELDAGFSRSRKNPDAEISVESNPNRILLDDLEKVRIEDARLKSDMESIFEQLPSGERTPERIRQLAIERANALEADIASKALQGPTKRQVDRSDVISGRDRDVGMDVKTNTGNLQATLGQKRITPAIAGETAVNPKESAEAVKRLNKEIAAPIAQAAARSGRQVKVTPEIPVGTLKSFENRPKPSAEELKRLEDLIIGQQKGKHIGSTFEQQNAPLGSPAQQQAGEFDMLLELLNLSDRQFRGN